MLGGEAEFCRLFKYTSGCRAINFLIAPTRARWWVLKIWNIQPNCLQRPVVPRFRSIFRASTLNFNFQFYEVQSWIAFFSTIQWSKKALMSGKFDCWRIYYFMGRKKNEIRWHAKMWQRKLHHDLDRSSHVESNSKTNRPLPLFTLIHLVL